MYHYKLIFDRLAIFLERIKNVFATPRFGRNPLHHHPIGALDPGQVEQVFDGDVVAPSYAGNAPGGVVEGHLDLALDAGCGVLAVQSWPGHGRQRVGKLAHD
jgi:hypothetical protein